MPRRREVHVQHVITGLETGGAEILLERLIPQLTLQGVRSSVVSLAGIGPVGSRLLGAGVDVRALAPAGLLGRMRLLRSATDVMMDASPDLVHTWLVHSDFIGGLAARTLGLPIVWSVHHSGLGVGVPRATKLLDSVNSRLSTWVPDEIICTSDTTRRMLETRKYPKSRLSVIKNPVDSQNDRFPPRAEMRGMLGLPMSARVVGHVARFSPQKDHATLLAALSRVMEQDPRVQAVLVGRGVTRTNPSLSRLLSQAPFRGRLHLLGERHDARLLQSAFDVSVSSSAYGETFPLVLGEAVMAGVPVVTTDVGDSAEFARLSGVVVRPRDPTALALGITRILAAHRGETVEKAAQETKDYFIAQYGMEAGAARYSDIYRRVISARGRGMALDSGRDHTAEG